MTLLICESHLRKHILERTKTLRSHLKITRVSKGAIQDFDTYLRLYIDKRIQAHPTKGRTFEV